VRIEGLVVVDAVVLEDATIGDNAEVVQSLDADLDEQAVKAAMRWRFKPATKHGEPIAMHVAIEQWFGLPSQ
jgi:TonB family protein